jgi:hypothetical protein
LRFMPVGERGGVLDDLLLVRLELRVAALPWKQTALAGDDVHRADRPGCPGTPAESISFAVLSCTGSNPPRGPRSVLCVVVVTKSACGIGLG